MKYSVFIEVDTVLVINFEKASKHTTNAHFLNFFEGLRINLLNASAKHLPGSLVVNEVWSKMSSTTHIPVLKRCTYMVAVCCDSESLPYGVFTRRIFSPSVSNENILPGASLNEGVNLLVIDEILAMFCYLVRMQGHLNFDSLHYH